MLLLRSISWPTVKDHFKLKIWLSITQHFEETELLRTAIKHAGGRHDGEQDKTLLTRTLIGTLSMGRFLLVLDDVWGMKLGKMLFVSQSKEQSKNNQGTGS